jgi:hypothetical protein
MTDAERRPGDTPPPCRAACTVRQAARIRQTERAAAIPSLRQTFAPSIAGIRQIFHGALDVPTKFRSKRENPLCPASARCKKDHRLPWKIAAPQHRISTRSALLENPVVFQNFDFKNLKLAPSLLEKSSRFLRRGARFAFCC